MTRKKGRLNSSFDDYQCLRGIYNSNFSIVLLLIKFIDYEQKVFYVDGCPIDSWRMDDTGC